MRYGIVVILLCLLTNLRAQNFWVQKDSVKGPGKSVACAFSLNGTGYIVSGLTSSGFVRSMYSYDVNQDDWDDAQSMGGLNGGGLSRGSASSFTIGGNGYICLGQGDNGNYVDDVWEYNPIADVWSQKANYGGSPRRAAVAFTIGSFAYVGTGQDVSGLRKDFYKYDPIANQWTAVADFGGTARKYAVGFSMGNQGYVGTGNDGVMRSDFWQYQVSTNTWIQKTNFPGGAREGAVAWGEFPNGYIATGEDQNFNYLNDVWVYNYFTDTWNTCAPLPGPGRKHAITFTVGGLTYVGTGYTGDYVDDFYAYDGVTSTMESDETDHAVSIYPLPASTYIIADWTGSDYNEVKYTIRDAQGRDVTSSFSFHTQYTQCRIEFNDAPTGNYFLCLLNEDGSIFSVKPFLIAGN